MKRVIKFIAFDPIGKTFYKVAGWNFESEEVRIVNDTYDLWVDTDDVILLQFTGLYDKNGKEIYEGDILAPISKESFYYVSFESGMFCIYNNLGRWATIERGIEIYKELNIDFEIIGNIHENAELVK